MKGCSSRERVLAALEHRQVDRPAFSWGFGPQPPVEAALNEYLKPRGMNYGELRRRTSDVRSVGPTYNGPKLPPHQSIWGYTLKKVCYGAGHYDEFDYQPLANVKSVDDVESHPWPDPQMYDYSYITESLRRLDAAGNHAIFTWGGNPMEIMSWMMGLENMLMLLLSDPDIIHAAIRHITHFFVGRTRRTLEQADGRIDFVFCADDLGTQNGLMISRETYRKMIMPYHKELYDTIHRHGVAVMHHSDGSVFELLDDLIEAGVDCLEAVQVECKDMKPEKLKSNFGDRLAFQGAVSVQQLLPRTDEEGVRKQVRRLKAILGAAGGYICAPSHALQAGTPDENIIAMVEEAVEKPLDEITESVS